MTELCVRYGISRITGYKWADRYRQSGLAGLEDHSRAPRSCPHETPEGQVGPSDVMNVLPTGLGAPRTVGLQGLLPTWAWFSLDGSALIVYGRKDAASQSGFYLLPLEGGTFRALTPEGVQGQLALSPDGRFLAVVKPDGQLAAYPLASGEVRALPPLQPGELPIQWSNDGRALFVGTYLSGEIHRVELQTGQRSLWRRLMTADRGGRGGFDDIFLTPDGRTYCYGAVRTLDELHLIDARRDGSSGVSTAGHQWSWVVRRRPFGRAAGAGRGRPR